MNFLVRGNQLGDFLFRLIASSFCWKNNGYCKKSSVTSINKFCKTFVPIIPFCIVTKQTYNNIQTIIHSFMELWLFKLNNTSVDTTSTLIASSSEGKIFNERQPQNLIAECLFEQKLNKSSGLNKNNSKKCLILF